MLGDGWCRFGQGQVLRRPSIEEGKRRLGKIGGSLELRPKSNSMLDAIISSPCVHFYTYGRMDRMHEFFNDKVEGTELQEADFIFKYRKNGENVLNRKTLILQPHSKLHRQGRKKTAASALKGCISNTASLVKARRQSMYLKRSNLASVKSFLRMKQEFWRACLEREAKEILSQE